MWKASKVVTNTKHHLWCKPTQTNQWPVERRISLFHVSTLGLVPSTRVFFVGYSDTILFFVCLFVTISWRMLSGTFCNTASRNFKEVMKFLFGFERVEYSSVFTRNHMCIDPLVNLSKTIFLSDQFAGWSGNINWKTVHSYYKDYWMKYKYLNKATGKPALCNQCHYLVATQ